MPDQPDLDQSVAMLTNYFVGDATLGDTLTRVSELTLQSIPLATFVGITLMINDKVGTYVFTNPEMVEIDRAQYDTGDGPCLHAFHTGETVFIRSTSSSDLWRQFSAMAASHGVNSTVSIPLSTHTRTIGALNVYSTAEDAFSELDADFARGFATQAAFLLSNAQAYWDARSLSENLQTAMESRAEIEQAKGIIMSATGCTAEEAFQQLRAQSQHQNIKLRDVAREIVAATQRRR